MSAEERGPASFGEMRDGEVPETIGGEASRMTTSDAVWAVVVENAPSFGPGGELGLTYQIIQCPNDDYAVMALPTTIYQLAGAKGTFRCPSCEQDFAAPPQPDRMHAEMALQAPPRRSLERVPPGAGNE